MRAFVAVWPPPAVVRRLTEIDRPVRPGVRWTTEDQWHVTLRFLGEIGEEQVQGVNAALEAPAPVGRVKPVTAVAGPALARLGPSILCVPVSGLDELAAAVMAATATVGDVPSVPDRPFRGHVTVARARRGVRLAPAPPGAVVPFAASWPVGEVTLVASTLHPAGARYQVVGRYPLAAS